MQQSIKPLVLAAPEPRSIDLIFTPAQKDRLYDLYDVVDVPSDELDTLDVNTLARARYIVGQPPLSLELLQRMSSLRCVFNVESNLLDNMPYDYLFEQGIHVVTTGAVFAEPVAELGLAMALNLARQVLEADSAFRAGQEQWGLDGNQNASLLTGSRIGFIGFGDLGRALARLLTGFRADLVAYDPWLPESMLQDQGVRAMSLEELLKTSDTVFVVAAVTTENQHFLDAHSFSIMKPGSHFILLSRADVVDFDALMMAVHSGHIRAASDVYPIEPLPVDHSVRKLPGFIRSAHRAGALDSAFKKMGDMVLEDMNLLDKGLPPMRCKRAERETVARMRSKPITVN